MLLHRKQKGYLAGYKCPVLFNCLGIKYRGMVTIPGLTLIDYQTGRFNGKPPAWVTKRWRLRTLPEDEGGTARYLSHLDEPTLKPTIDDKVVFSAMAETSTKLGLPQKIVPFGGVPFQSARAASNPILKGSGGSAPREAGQLRPMSTSMC